MTKKYFSFIVVPHDDSNVRNYRMSYFLVGLFIALLVLSVISGVVFVATYGKVLHQAHQSHMFENENEQLRERNAQVDSLRTQLVRMQTMGIQLKKMLGVGLTEQDSILVANLSPIVNSPAINDGDELSDVDSEGQKQLLRAVPSLWPIKGYVTKEFYSTGGDKSPQYHPGMDIAARRNMAIQASAEGVVTESGWDDTYGYLVILDHGFGLTTLYGHNARNVVKANERVSRGQTLAFVGNTGKSTAPHLHFEVKKNGVPVDPRNYLLN